MTDQGFVFSGDLAQRIAIWEPTVQLRLILPDAPPPQDQLVGSTPIPWHWPAILQQAFLDRASGDMQWRTVPLAIIPRDEYEAARKQ